MTDGQHIHYIVAVIVTYNPDGNILGRLIDACSPQVDAMVLADNSDNVQLADWLTQKNNAKVTLLELGGNQGIAAAQNAGIEWARAHNATHVLLFDHDSTPPIDLVTHLHAALTDLETMGEKVAAVGPRCVDSRWSKDTTPSPFFRFKYGLRFGCYPTDTSSYVASDFLYASGSLIPMKVLDDIGGMTKELFIEYVDIEWCLRARQAGWSLYGIWNVVMEHNLGDARVTVFGRSFPVHSALRHYYAIRNAVWMCCRTPLLWKWKLAIAYNGLRRFIAYSLFMPKPLTHLRFMCRGTWHGLIGRMGKLDV